MVKAPTPELGTLVTPQAAAERPERRTEALTPAELGRENRRHDLILAGLTLLLAFLLASFPVLNPDILMQLGTGQAILNGTFSFGADPFAFTEHALWVHTAWLWDVLVYGVYSLAGGPGLVLLRGLLMLGLGMVLFQIRRTDVTLLPVVLSLALAFVVISARLFLRSDVISVVFTGLTLYLLWRPARPPRWVFAQRVLGLTHNHAWVFLPPLFAIWANCDYWFFLGPGMVLLYLSGEYLQRQLNPHPVHRGGLSPDELRSLGLVFLVGLLACAINPYTLRVFFQLPGDSRSEALQLILSNELSLKQGPLRGLLSPLDPAFYPLRWEHSLWWRPLGLNLAEWCFFPLAVLSGLSFLFNWKGMRYWRVLLWLGFLLLSLWQGRNAAFFAVVAGPVMALNFQDWIATRVGLAPSIRPAWVIAGQAGRLLALVGILMLCFLMTQRVDLPSVQRRGRETALGLIHTRAVGWSMPVDPSLRNAAQQLAAWQLPGRGFSFDWREQPAYLAFYSPDRQSFMDARFQLQGGTARDFYAIGQHLREVNPDRLDKRPTHQHLQWQEAFRKHDISHLILSSNVTVPIPGAPAGVPGRRLVDLLLADEIETTDAGGQRSRQPVWDLLNYVDGRTFILAWTGSPHYPQLQALHFDPVREAFQRPSHTPPERGPDYSQLPGPLVRLLKGELNRPPLGADESAWLLTWEVSHDQGFRQAVGSCLLPLGMTPSHGLAGAGVAVLPLLYTESQTHSTYYLAIRAARRAIAEQPDHPEAYYFLYRAYADLYQTERQRGPAIGLREVQMAAALREAVRRRPQEWLPQLELAALYLRRGVSDLAVAHFEQGVLNAEAVGLNKELLAQVAAEPGLAQLRPLFQHVARMSQDVAKREANFNMRAALNNDPAERARIATELGLQDEARQAMEAAVSRLATHPPQIGDAAVMRLADLYLRLGYLPELVALLNRAEARARLGPAPFYQWAALAYAAMGDYQSSLQQYQLLDDELKRVAVERTLLGVGLHSRGANSEPPGTLLHGLKTLYEAQSLNAQRAELLFDAGLVALEAGWTKPRPDGSDAPALFRKAFVEVYAGAPQRPLGVRYYRLMTNQWLEE